jgi:hypothetical protein
MKGERRAFRKLGILYHILLRLDRSITVVIVRERIRNGTQRGMLPSKNVNCTNDVYLSVIVFPQPAHSCCVEPFLFVSDLLTSIVIVISATAPSATLQANRSVKNIPARARTHVTAGKVSETTTREVAIAATF